MDPTEHASRAVFVLATVVVTVVAFLGALASIVVGLGLMVIVGWVLIGACGAALAHAGGRTRRMGTAVIAGDALGALLFCVALAIAYQNSNG